MRISYCGIVLVGLLLLCSASAAADTQISLNTDTEWLVAGSGGTSTVTVTATNATTVVLSCNSTMGTVTPSTLELTAGEEKTANFTVGTKSGDAQITATAQDGTGAVVAENTTIRRVDHAGPYTYSDLSYEREVHVGTTTSISLVLKDRYGNPVDNRNDTEEVTFSVGSPDGGARFDGGASSTTRGVDERGKVTVNLTLGRKAGENIIYVEMPGKVSPLYLTIDGLGENVPEKILEPEVDPSSKSVPANGKDIFVVTFTTIDRYGNPCAGAGINISTSLPREPTKTARTNRDGRVTITYGPKTTTGDVTITAAAVNSTATAETTVRFTSTAPVQMVLTASPQMMASWDVPGARPAQVMAKVMDEMGNPVGGEVVTFTIVDSPSYPTTQTEKPRWNTTSEATITATTNDNGYAVVLFRPGYFSGYGPSSNRANCTVKAQWKTYPTQTLKMEWTNVPYLSVLTNVTPPNPAWNETVEVNITLIGNGYKLQPKPIDVVLAIDRSGSMGDMDKAGANMTRIDAAKNAAKTFVSQMNPDMDRIGLVSYSFDATCVRSLNYPLGVNDTISGSVNDTIDDTAPPRGWTATRKALRESIGEVKGEGRSDAVRAVILMSDGEYNCYGDPLARGRGFLILSTILPTRDQRWIDAQSDYTYFFGLDGLSLKDELEKLVWEWLFKGRTIWDDGGLRYTSQNMSIYAKNNDIRLYMISFSDDIKENDTTWETMDILAETTGGKHYHAATGDDLARIYTEIAGELQTEAGVNTTLSLDFTNVQVKTNTTSWPIPGHEAFDYRPYTRERMDWITNGTNIYTRNTRDDTGNWTRDSLTFDIGTIKLNQSWQTTFSLKVRPDESNVGIIDLFGNGSKLIFNDGADSLTLPHTPLTVKRTQNNTPIGDATLDISGLKWTGIGRDALDLTWNMTYIGNRTAVEVVEYRSTTMPWTHVRTLTRGNGTWEKESAKMGIKNLPLTRYVIRVSANSEDAGYRENTTEVDLGSIMGGKNYIVLE